MRQERGVILNGEGLSVTLNEVGGAENCRENFPDSIVHAKALRQESSWKV